MFKFVIIGTVVALASAQSHPVNKQIVQEIRERTHRWEAYDVETNPFRNYTFGKLMSLLGTITNPPAERTSEYKYADVELLKDVPANWDWRT